jgi:orotate phosphoribosyltransferase
MLPAYIIHTVTADQTEYRGIPREQRVREILDRTGAVLTGDHFLYASGKHGDKYINKDAVYPHTQETRELTRMWAEDFRDSGVEVVVGPAMGGIILSHDTASALSELAGYEVPGVYAEKAEDDSFRFTRGYDEMVRGKKVLVVEDILTTGDSVKKTVDLVRETGGEVIGVAALVNRGGVTTEDIGIPRLVALLSVNFTSMSPEDCNLCEQGVPINTQVGHGKNLANRTS